MVTAILIVALIFMVIWNFILMLAIYGLQKEKQKREKTDEKYNAFQAERSIILK